MCFIAAALAALAGLAKFARPHTAVAAMRSASLPSGAAAVRVGSVIELALGALVLLTGYQAPRLLLALGYVGFAAFVVGAGRGGRRVPCGCFGDAGAPMGWRHAGTDLVLAAGLATAGLGDAPSVASLVHRSAGPGLVTALVTVTGAVLVAAYLSGPPVREVLDV